MAPSIGVAIVSMALYGVFETLWVLAVIVAVHSVADAFTMPANQLAIACSVPEGQIASGQGLMGALGLLTAALAAGLGAWVYGMWGAGVLYGGTAAAMLALLIGAWRLGEELRRPV